MTDRANVTNTSRSTGQVLLTRSELTGTVYVVTKWKDRGNGNIEAVEKFDVGEQFVRLALDVLNSGAAGSHAIVDRAEVREMREIVAGIAETKPTYEASNSLYCNYCTMGANTHEMTCPYRRAVRLAIKPLNDALREATSDGG